MIRGVHHITLLVRDLNQAMQRYRQQLGIAHFEIADLPPRGVRTACFMAGATAIVLVEPVADGEPMRQLRASGEGLFLLSLEVDDLDKACDHLVAGGGQLRGEPREGLKNWRVVDVAPECLNGAPIQLTQVMDPEVTDPLQT